MQPSEKILGKGVSGEQPQWGGKPGWFQMPQKARAALTLQFLPFSTINEYFHFDSLDQTQNKLG